MSLALAEAGRNINGAAAADHAGKASDVIVYRRLFCVIEQLRITLVLL